MHIDENWEKIVRLGCSFHVEFSSKVITMYKLVKESHRIQEEIANFFVDYLINLLIYIFIYLFLYILNTCEILKYNECLNK